MARTALHSPKSELSGRIQTLMLMRVICVSILLGASIFIQIKETRTTFGYIQNFHYVLIATIYLLTFIYILLYRHSRRLLSLAYLQLLVDTVFVSAIIFATGGIGSIFSFLYILTIINGSIIDYRRGGMIIASSSSILYGLLIDLHYYGVIHPPGTRVFYGPDVKASSALFSILVNITAFYLVAFLSSYLSEQIRKGRVELKARQNDIHKLEILNESIINCMNSGLMALDGKGKVILFNPAAEVIFGMERNGVLGRDIQECFPAVHKVLMENLTGRGLSSARSTPTPFIDLPHPVADGSQMHLRLSVSPLQLPSGEGGGRILFFQNMTEIREIEEEMKRVEGLAIIGELAAAIAHEIRNPMASISGSIQMLKDGLSQDDINNRLMEIILREINRLNHLINEFLLFARPKKVNLQSFDLGQMILETLELFRNSQHWDGRVRIHTELCRGVNLESDPEQFKQVLWNLLLNGSEAMPRGGELHITTERTNGQGSLQQGEERVRTSVRDCGPGFDRRALDHLFRPFFTTKEGGSGLGLAIVKRIVEGLKGEVSGANHPEGGAIVTVTLPLKMILKTSS